MAANPKETAQQLRKLATSIRDRVAAEEALRIKQAAHVLRAGKGLTILRDKVRA